MTTSSLKKYLVEGYESKVISICKDAGIDCSFKDGKMYVDKEDMAKAKKALKDNEDIKELPDMVAESKLNEDSVDMEKHNKLNDMFLALEKLNDEYDELEQMDREQPSSGAGDLTDQLVTMGKLISGLFQVLDRSSKIVPMESVNEAVDQALIDSVVDQIMRDIEMGDQTAIEELLMSCPEDKLKGFLSDVEESKQSQDLAHLKKLAGIEENVDQQYADVLATKNQIKINAFLQNLDPKTATRLTGGKAQTSRISKDGQSFLPSGDPYVHGKP